MKTHLLRPKSVRPSSILACAALLAGFTSALSAQTFIFQEGLNGYAGTSDTYISRHDADEAINYGSSNVLVTRYTNGNSAGLSQDGLNIARESRTILIRFDDLGLSGTVASASITLTIESFGANSGQGVSNSTNVQFLAYQPLSSWSESEATWNISTTGNAWNSPGARGEEDRNLTPLFTSTSYRIHGTSGVNLFPGNTITIPLPTSLVQAWLDDPSSNYGILVSVGASNKDRFPSVSFHSSEAADINLRPQLTITGDLALAQIPEPSSAAALLGLGGLAAAALRRNRRRD